jgi:mannosyltransferase OCH1-like enzyme
MKVCPKICYLFEILFYQPYIMIKIIHQIWFDLGNGKNLPDKYKLYQSSWIEHQPKWKYILWDEQMGTALVKKSILKYSIHFLI